MEKGYFATCRRKQKKIIKDLKRWSKKAYKDHHLMSTIIICKSIPPSPLCVSVSVPLLDASETQYFILVLHSSYLPQHHQQVGLRRIKKNWFPPLVPFFWPLPHCQFPRSLSSPLFLFVSSLKIILKFNKQK